MAETREPFNQDKPRRETPVSSDELIKRAWDSIGRAESGERSAEKSDSASGVMTSSANVSSTASSAERTLAAEEIARLLREEEPRRQPSPRPTKPARPRRVAASDSPPPRPRRAPPIEVPHTQQAPSQLPPPRVPPQRTPEQGQPAPARRAGRPGWLVFVVIAALLSIVGRFADDGQSESSDPAETIPATTEPFGRDSLLMSEADLEPGLCVLWLPAGENAVVATVPCAEPHQYEVFGVVDAAAASAEYSGAEETYDLGLEACFEEFSDYVGESYVESPWYIEAIPPTEAEWVGEGDRSATCLLFQLGPDGYLYSEGSARDSGSS